MAGRAGRLSSLQTGQPICKHVLGGLFPGEHSTHALLTVPLSLQCCLKEITNDPSSVLTEAQQWLLIVIEAFAHNKLPALKHDFQQACMYQLLAYTQM